MDIADLLRSNTQFIQLSDMYQYYKLEAIALKCQPVQVDGDWPPIAYSYLFGANELNIQYSSIPRLPGSKLIKNNKTTTLYFKRIGIQEDFNFYKDSGQEVSCSLRVRLAEPLQKAKYVFQLKFFIRFNMLVQYGSSTIQAQEKFQKILPKEVFLNNDIEPNTSFSIKASPKVVKKNYIAKIGNIDLGNKQKEIPQFECKPKLYPGLQDFKYDDNEDLDIEEIRQNLNEIPIKDDPHVIKKVKKPKIKDPGGQ
jgi:hypothetical protein